MNYCHELEKLQKEIDSLEAATEKDAKKLNVLKEKWNKLFRLFIEETECITSLY